jgi:hypothetical protein
MTARTRSLLAAGSTTVLVLASLAASIGAVSAATAGPCGRHQLAVTQNGSEGAAGTIYGAWVFKNVSDTRCTISGYPSLQLYGRRGRPIPTNVGETFPRRPESSRSVRAPRRRSARATAMWGRIGARCRR